MKKNSAEGPAQETAAGLNAAIFSQLRSEPPDQGAKNLRAAAGEPEGGRAGVLRTRISV